MITTPTVSVLVAGSELTLYGFPTAKGLKELICEQFSSTGATASQLLSCRNPEGSKFAPEEFSKFRQTFLKSGQPSVDAFLQCLPASAGEGGNSAHRVLSHETVMGYVNRALAFFDALVSIDEHQRNRYRKLQRRERTKGE